MLIKNLNSALSDFYSKDSLLFIRFQYYQKLSHNLLQKISNQFYNGFLPDELVTVMLMYYIIAGKVAFWMRQTLPKEYTRIKDFIPFVTCIKSNRWSEDAVLETVLEITARHAELSRDQFNEYSDFFKDIGLD